MPRSRPPAQRVVAAGVDPGQLPGARVRAAPVSAAGAAGRRARARCSSSTRPRWQVDCDAGAPLVRELRGLCLRHLGAHRLARRATAASSTAPACACGCDGREADAARARARRACRADWEVATGAGRAAGERGFGTYEAADYDELVDHPVEMGALLARRVRGRRRAAPSSWWPARCRSFDGERLLADTQRSARRRSRFWHGRASKPPFERYVFLLTRWTTATAAWSTAPAPR